MLITGTVQYTYNNMLTLMFVSYEALRGDKLVYEIKREQANNRDNVQVPDNRREFSHFVAMGVAACFADIELLPSHFGMTKWDYDLQKQHTEQKLRRWINQQARDVFWHKGKELIRSVWNDLEYKSNEKILQSKSLRDVMTAVVAKITKEMTNFNIKHRGTERSMDNVLANLLK